MKNKPQWLVEAEKAIQEFEETRFGKMTPKEFKNWEISQKAILTQGKEGLSSRAKKLWSNKTQEEREELTRKLADSRSKEERSETSKKIQSKFTKEERSEIAKKRESSMTPEEKSMRSKKSMETFGRERSSELAKKVNESMGFEKRSERAKKRAENLGAEKLSEITKLSAENRALKRSLKEPEHLRDLFMSTECEICKKPFNRGKLGIKISHLLNVHQIEIKYEPLESTVGWYNDGIRSYRLKHDEVPSHYKKGRI